MSSFSFDEVKPKPTKSGKIKTVKKKPEPTPSKIYSSIVADSNHMRTEKRWFIIVFTAIMIMLITSSFTLAALDKFLLARNVDLFNKANMTNEIILNVVQFALVAGLLTYALKQF